MKWLACGPTTGAWQVWESYSGLMPAPLLLNTVEASDKIKSEQEKPFPLLTPFLPSG